MAYRVYSKTVDVTIPQGQTSGSAKIVCPTVGAIHKVAVRQVSGTSTAATLYLFGSEGVTANDYDLKTVIPKLSISAGSTASQFSDHGWRYGRFDDMHAVEGLVATVTIGSAAGQNLTYRIFLVLSTHDG